MDLLIHFQNWLKTLGDGEISFYTMLITGIVTFLGWIIRRFFKRNAAAKMQSDAHAEASVMASAPKISIDTVNAEAYGTAFGLFQGEFTQIVNGAPLRIWQ